MQVDGNDLMAALKAQRNGSLDEAAMLKAALDGAGRRIAELEAALAKRAKKKSET